MTSQEKKAYLERYKEADREIDRLCEELSRWRARATKITPALSQETAGGREEGNQVELAVEKINTKIDELLIIRQRVEDAIQTVMDGTLREVLTQRYILGKRWEQIAVDMNYSWRRIYQLHGKALLQLCIEFQYEPVI